MSNANTDLHVVLGANGGIGGALVNEIVRQGLPARVVTRNGMSQQQPGIEHVTADLMDAQQAEHAIAGASVVYHAANPPYTDWVAQFPPLNRSIIEATAAAGARLIFADNLYMYGPDAGVMTEVTPQRATDKKGRLRIRLAKELLDAHEAGTVQVSIGRASDYFGPGGLVSALGERFFEAALAGKTVRWVGDPSVAHSVSYLPDIAAGLVTLGLRDEALGRAWHLPTSGAPSGQEFGQVLAKTIDQPVTVSGTPRWMMKGIGVFSPQIREVAEMMHQWNAPFVSSDAAFQEAFGPQPATALGDAVQATVEWFRSRPAKA
jgi:nucleoside-diphosphate-sugar epimerase